MCCCLNARDLDSLAKHHLGKFVQSKLIRVATDDVHTSFCSMPYQAMFAGPQQGYAQGSPGGASPWAQYPYQQAYGAAAAQV